MTDAPFPSFDPDPDAFLRRLRPQVSDATLRQIAALDYGYDAAENFVALQRMRDEFSFPSPIHWNPLEVMRLGLGGPFANYAKQPAMTAEEAEWARCFLAACWLRLLGTGDNCDRHGEFELMPAALEMLDGPITRRCGLEQDALGLLVWLAPLLRPHDGGRVFVAIAALGLALAVSADPDAIVALTAWILAEEARLQPGLVDSHGPFHRDHLSKRWVAFGAAVQGMDLSALPPSAQRDMRELGRLLEAAAWL